MLIDSRKASLNSERTRSMNSSETREEDLHKTPKVTQARGWRAAFGVKALVVVKLKDWRIKK